MGEDNKGVRSKQIDLTQVDIRRLRKRGLGFSQRYHLLLNLLQVKQHMAPGGCLRHCAD